jgi:hypothetical protein
MSSKLMAASIATLIISGWFALAGCAATPRQPTQRAEPTIIKVVPVIVTSGPTLPRWVSKGGLHWLDDAPGFYEETPFRIEIGTAETLDKPEWFAPDRDMRLAMRSWAKRRYRAKGVVTVFYVDDIPYPGREARGLAYKGTPCAFLAFPSARILAHELGHCLGLADLTGDQMCGPVRRCNVMTYCYDAQRAGCEGPLWGAKQLLLMRSP